MIKITLKKNKEQSILRKHPWVFSGAIETASQNVEEGDQVEILDANGKFLGRGISSVGSIAVRILTFEQEEFNANWWIKKIKAAYQVRKTIGLAQNQQTNCYRLIHGEGDGLPGLIVDLYGQTAVIQAHAVGIYLMRKDIAAALVETVGVKAVYDKSSGTVSGIEAIDGYLVGTHIEEELREDGLILQSAWEGGQKTGFFIDQRDNRKLLKHYAQNRRVLNTFCYTGGFSLSALAGGATEVVSVDASARAIEGCTTNIKRNFPNALHSEVVADAPDYVKNMKEGAFDLIVLDPPAFAKHRGALNNALQAYKRLNGAAIARCAPGSIIFTFSCSQAVSKDQFRLAVFSGAAAAGRSVRILHFLSQGADHPINIYHPEGEYLKGLVLYVE